ncbi:MAG: hypothetical protein EOP84_06545 [Verrucomicrobiaceae bacterium]|nr:MAG: hypothetical protein EOP84_06545 [Verrucomicrobiaceae bacterium]
MLLVDMYDGYFYAVAKSHTSPDVFYELTGDCTTGELKCSCPDSQCRAKVADIAYRTGGCKHAAALFVEIDALNALADWDEYERLHRSKP